MTLSQIGCMRPAASTIDTEKRRRPRFAMVRFVACRHNGHAACWRWGKPSRNHRATIRLGSAGGCLRPTGQHRIPNRTEARPARWKTSPVAVMRDAAWQRRRREQEQARTEGGKIAPESRPRRPSSPLWLSSLHQWLSEKSALPVSVTPRRRCHPTERRDVVYQRREQEAGGCFGRNQRETSGRAVPSLCLDEDHGPFHAAGQSSRQARLEVDFRPNRAVFRTRDLDGRSDFRSGFAERDQAMWAGPVQRLRIRCSRAERQFDGLGCSGCIIPAMIGHRSGAAGGRRAATCRTECNREPRTTETFGVHPPQIGRIGRITLKDRPRRVTCRMRQQDDLEIGVDIRSAAIGRKRICGSDRPVGLLERGLKTRHRNQARPLPACDPPKRCGDAGPSYQPAAAASTPATHRKKDMLGSREG